MSRVAILDDNKTWLRALRAALVGKKVIRIEELNGCPNIITEPEDTEEAGQNEIGQKRKNMKKFNLEEALQGKPVVTRDGRKVGRVVHLPEASDSGYEVVASIVNVGRLNGYLETYTKEGLFLEGATDENGLDLFMESAKREGWVNIYTKSTAGLRDRMTGRLTGENIYNNEECARTAALPGLIATVRIEWEE